MPGDSRRETSRASSSFDDQAPFQEDRAGGAGQRRVAVVGVGERPERADPQRSSSTRSWYSRPTLFSSSIATRATLAASLSQFAAAGRAKRPWTNSSSMQRQRAARGRNAARRRSGRSCPTAWAAWATAVNSVLVGGQCLERLPGELHRLHHAALAGVAARCRPPRPPNVQLVQPLLELVGRGQLDGLAQAARPRRGRSRSRASTARATSRPRSPIAAALATGWAKPIPSTRSRCRNDGAVQVEKGRLLALHAAVLAQVEVQLLLDGRAVLRQLEPLQLALEVVLDRRLADALGQLADRRAHVDAGQRLLDRRSARRGRAA